MTDSDEAVRTSARGWLTLQLAALGFVGLCGALKAGGSGASWAPRAVEAVAGILVLVALALAILAIYLVGRTAWPPAGGPEDPARAARRLRTGLLLTFATVLLTAVAATSSWWPAPEAADRAPGGTGAPTVQVTTSSGSVCGELTTGSSPLTLVVQGQTVDVPLTDVTSVAPVTGCGST